MCRTESIQSTAATTTTTRRMLVGWLFHWAKVGCCHVESAATNGFIHIKGIHCYSSSCLADKELHGQYYQQNNNDKIAITVCVFKKESHTPKGEATNYY
mmetsp:Transcript_4047/g.6089  ORF Transcript_4047/g.6089 Transcript_4047/m.6089 type:complete len:99 (-) Transcript_4047:28-324(-)